MDTFISSDETGDVSSSPINVTRLIVISTAILLIVIYMCTVIDNRATHNEHDQMVNGVKRGLMLYSQSYSKTTDAMKTLGEGYLISEDQDYSKGLPVSNPVQIDVARARSNFLQLVADNAPTDVDSITKMNFYVAQITTNFSFPTSNSVTQTYSYTLYKMSDGTVGGSGSGLNDIDSVQTGIEDSIRQCSGVSIKTNLGTQVNHDIHKTLVYGESSNFADLSPSPKLLGTTMNTFVCIGADIPIKARFGFGLANKKINIVELQSYATSR